MTSTAYSRDLGDELRRLRQRFTGLRGRAFAIQLGWDPSKVSNVEHGKIRANEVDIVQYLTVCGKDLDFCLDFLARYRNAFDSYLALVSDNLRTLAMTESMAKKITSYEVVMVPGLLQTKQYAHQLLAESETEMAPEDIADLVERRMERQTVLRRPHRPECVFYVHELALQLRLGDARLMEDQYVQLQFDTHVLRVVPAHIRTAVLQSKCTLYEFENAPPVVHGETGTAQVFAQDGAAVEHTRKVFERLDAVALGEKQSRRKLAEYVSALGA
jgi:hypothetical protein